MTDAEADLEEVLRVLVRLASGDFAARGTASGASEEFAALLLGVNMLAEELEAGRAELEQRVRTRTAELERLNSDILALSALGDRLQQCGSTEEAIAVTVQGVEAMFAQLTGALYLRATETDALALVTSWGGASPVGTTLRPAECQALHRVHGRTDGSAGPVRGCTHLMGGTLDSICVPMTAPGQVLGMLHLADLTDDAVTGSAHNELPQRLATAAAERAAMALVNLRLREALREQAMRDPLTGLYNRRFMDEWVQGEVSRTDRAGGSLGIVLVDVDLFKQVNDEHGHEAGDEVLRAIAAALRDSLRPEDISCRYGGDEFILLLSFIDLETLGNRAEDLRSRVAELRLEHDGTELPSVTVSAGFAAYPEHGSSPARVFAAADAALYRAKRSGRNRVLPPADDT